MFSNPYNPKRTRQQNRSSGGQALSGKGSNQSAYAPGTWGAVFKQAGKNKAAGQQALGAAHGALGAGIDQAFANYGAAEKAWWNKYISGQATGTPSGDFGYQYRTGPPGYIPAGTGASPAAPVKPQPAAPHAQVNYTGQGYYTPTPTNYLANPYSNYNVYDPNAAAAAPGVTPEVANRIEALIAAGVDPETAVAQVMQQMGIDPRRPMGSLYNSLLTVARSMSPALPANPAAPAAGGTPQWQLEKNAWNQYGLNQAQFQKIQNSGRLNENTGNMEYTFEGYNRYGSPAGTPNPLVKKGAKKGMGGVSGVSYHTPKEGKSPPPGMGNKPRKPIAPVAGAGLTPGWVSGMAQFNV